MAEPFAQFFVTLEGSNIVSGSDYPQDDYVFMSAPFITNLTAGSNPTNTFGAYTVPVTLGADIYFRTPPQPPNISYTSPDVYTIGSPVNLSPTNSGGPVSTYSISPTTLPLDLTFNPGTGVISGTPTEYLPSVTYTVTATNPGGSNSYNITLTPATNPITYDVISGKVTATSFNLTVYNSAGTMVFSTSSTVTGGGPDNIPGFGTSTGSKVVLQVTSGYMPSSSYLATSFPIVTGIISGNTITFSNVNLSIPETVTIGLGTATK
jgi:hypothetical protein